MLLSSSGIENGHRISILSAIAQSASTTVSDTAANDEHISSIKYEYVSSIKRQ